MTDLEIIKNLGGTVAVANLCGLDKSAISQWKKRKIPKAWKLYLKRVKPSAFKGIK